MTTADPTAAFFRELDGQTQELPRRAGGRVRFDLVEDRRTSSWLVAVHRGAVAVTRGRRDADCVVSMDKELFEGIVRGDVHLMTATLRGELTVKGDWEMMWLVRRLLLRTDGGGS